MYKVHKQMHNISMVLKCHGWVQFFFFFGMFKKTPWGGEAVILKKEKLRNSGLDIYCLLHCTVSSEGKRSFTSSLSIPLHLPPSFSSWGAIFSSPTQKRSSWASMLCLSSFNPFSVMVPG